MSYRTALTERLIQILFKLVHRPHSRQELVRDFGVSSKTICRDIDALSGEFPVAQEKRGREIFYKFADGFEFKLPSFSIEEVATLLLAQKSIAGIGISCKDSFYARHGDSVLRKIRQSLPVIIQKKLNALSEVYGSAQIPAKNFSEHIETLDRLASCAVREKTVEVRYHGLTSDEEKKRTLEPYAVYFDPDGATLKLVAFDPDHRDLRVFSVDRISAVKELDKKFKRQKAFNLKDYLDKTCFNGIHGEPVIVRLRAKGVTARIFRERKFHPSQKIIRRKQKRGNKAEEITIELRVARGRGLHRFILSYLPEIEVVSPKEIREEIEQIIRASLPQKETK